MTLTFGEPSNHVLLAEFSQSGGSVNVSRNLELCVPTLGGATFFDASRGVYEEMKYELSDGELTVGSDFVVGSFGAAPTSFVQTGGTSKIFGNLRVEGSSSLVELSGGTMEVGSLEVAAGDSDNLGGGFLMSSTASLVVRDSLVLGWSATFDTIGVEGEKGGTIFLDGAEFSAQNPEDSGSDLRGIRLIAGGSPDEMNTIEAIHYDTGAGDVWQQRHQLGSLLIGMDGPANVRLQDQVNWNDGTEALYVDTLVLSAGSTLDLNRINLYYNELELGDGAEIFNYSANCSQRTYPQLNPDDLGCMRPENRDYLLQLLDIPVGDLNADGQVDFTDFLVISENFGLSVDGYQQGDIDMDGSVQFADFLQLSKNWGETGVAWELLDMQWNAVAAASVPEPSGTSFAIYFGIASACSRRRRNR